MPSELKRLRYVSAAFTELRGRRPLGDLPPEVRGFWAAALEHTGRLLASDEPRLREEVGKLLADILAYFQPLVRARQAG